MQYISPRRLYFATTSNLNPPCQAPKLPSPQAPKSPSSLVLLAHPRCPEVADCMLPFKMCSCSTDDDVGVTAREHAVGNATEHDGVVATEHGGVAATEHGLSTGCYRARSFHRHQWDRTKDIGDRTMCWTAAQALHTSHILSWVVTTSMRHNACWATYKAANLRAIMLVGGIGGLSARQLLLT